jgi:hypothetical protein
MSRTGSPASPTTALETSARFVDSPEVVTSTVCEITGRPARKFAEWARDNAGAFNNSRVRNGPAANAGALGRRAGRRAPPPDHAGGRPNPSRRQPAQREGVRPAQTTCLSRP